MLAISRSGLYKSISDGTIPSFKFGNRRLVPVKGMEAFIEQQVQLFKDESGIHVSAA
jgi:excisionase family DNA binding protein